MFWFVVWFCCFVLFFSDFKLSTIIVANKNVNEVIFTFYYLLAPSIFCTLSGDFILLEIIQSISFFSLNLFG